MPWIIVIALLAGTLLFTGFAVRARAQGAPSGLSIVSPPPDPQNELRAEWHRYSMCTRMMLPPGNPEYLCPVCGAKTIYAETNRWRMARLESVRRRMSALMEHNKSGYSFSLDETAYCRNCTPETSGEPNALLAVLAPDEVNRTTVAIHFEDISLLQRFANNPEMEMSSRLRELLGQEKESE